MILKVLASIGDERCGLDVIGMNGNLPTRALKASDRNELSSSTDIEFALHSHHRPCFTYDVVLEISTDRYKTRTHRLKTRGCVTIAPGFHYCTNHIVSYTGTPPGLL